MNKAKHIHLRTDSSIRIKDLTTFIRLTNTVTQFITLMGVTPYLFRTAILYFARPYFLWHSSTLTLFIFPLFLKPSNGINFILLSPTRDFRLHWPLPDSTRPRAMRSCLQGMVLLPHACLWSDMVICPPTGQSNNNDNDNENNSTRETIRLNPSPPSSATNLKSVISRRPTHRYSSYWCSRVRRYKPYDRWISVSTTRYLMTRPSASGRQRSWKRLGPWLARYLRLCLRGVVRVRAIGSPCTFSCWWTAPFSRGWRLMRNVFGIIWARMSLMRS